MDVLSAERFAAVAAAVGTRRAGELAAELGARVEALLEAAQQHAATPDTLIARTHQLRGSAATLGMQALVAALENLEIVIARRARDARGAAIDQARSAETTARRAAAAFVEGAEDHPGGRTSR